MKGYHHVIHSPLVFGFSLSLRRHRGEETFGDRTYVHSSQSMLEHVRIHYHIWEWIPRFQICKFASGSLTGPCFSTNGRKISSSLSGYIALLGRVSPSPLTGAVHGGRFDWKGWAVQNYRFNVSKGQICNSGKIPRVKKADRNIPRVKIVAEKIWMVPSICMRQSCEEPGHGFIHMKFRQEVVS